MADMPHWNAFVKRMLSEKPDKGDKGNFHAKLNIIKKVEKNDNFSEKERLKNGESK